MADLLKDKNTSDWESPDDVGEAALWLATHADTYDGRVVTLTQLRADDGLLV